MTEHTGNNTAGEPLHIRLNLTKSRTTKNGENYEKVIVGAEMDRPQGVDIVDAVQQLSDSLDLFLDSSTKPKTATLPAANPNKSEPPKPPPPSKPPAQTEQHVDPIAL